MSRTGVAAAPSGRTALFLYVLLVVLPAVVFGGLLWRQLQQYQDRLLAELPAECRDAAERLARACVARVEALRNDEARRPFEQYRASVFADDLGPVRSVVSELAEGSPREGVLGHYSFLLVDADPQRLDGVEVEVLRGRSGVGEDPLATLIERTVREAVLPEFEDDPMAAQRERTRIQQREGYGEWRERLIRTVVLNFAVSGGQECVQAFQELTELRDNMRHPVHVQYFELQRVDRDAGQAPLVLARRNVTTEQLLEVPLPRCIDAINDGVLMVQGFVIDPHWLLRTMPQEEASSVLGPSQRLLLGGEPAGADGGDTHVEPLRLLERLRLGADRATPGSLRVVADAGSLRRDFRVQNAWFAGMAAILTVSMVIGIRLLLASIRVSRTEAERTRNFVASVTHELRTPIAAVKLYGEMLRDGWVSDDERRAEYLGRIVHESDRLGGLVDRVLLRRRLYDQADAPEPGDLNAEIQNQRADLEVVGGRRVQDLRFELEDGLPRVKLLPDAVHVVLQNLVENARKYAPVEVGPDGAPLGEPIVVRTRRSKKGRVLLEVLDRGPGIPEKDRSRVFEAFLRLGDERTRSTKGTGLGLHLVALQARAMGAKVRALPRTGGGTVFQVTFAT